MTKQRIFFLPITLVIAVGVGYGWWRYQERQWLTLTNSDPRFSFQYQRKMLLSQGSDDEKKQGQPFVRIIQGQLADPLLITVRMETKLRVITSLSHKDLIPLLLANADSAHPKRFPDYHKESEREFELAGKKSAELFFTYTGPASERIKQRFLIIAYDGNTALYFAAQAKESDFDQVNQKYFNRMFKSLKFD